ncbi:DMT family transporter [Synechococcus sp. RSCCF101]|uniref:DMT family transporter n=1 Tax=Synechococcus sp. RSCCF101 TaxID=2511069 RepID=UPI001248938C|nr:DMT family transporter [Synechococcus sp. RSCCF101]QEY30925.1 DMT family transporter [Synechococcus sp. RSCCF101]
MPAPLIWMLMVLPFVLWGTAMAAMAPLVSSGGPWLVAGLRLFPAGLLLLLTLPLLGRSWRLDPRDLGWCLAFTVVDATLFQGLLAQGLRFTGAGLGSVLIDSQPLMVALLARLLFADPINPVGWFGLSLGLVAIACLGLPAPVLQEWWLQGPSAGFLTAGAGGTLLMLGAALAMASGTVLSRYACRHSDPVAVTAWHMLAGSLPLLLAHVLTVGPPAQTASTLLPPWGPAEWGLMAYASLFGGAIAYGLFFWFAGRGSLTSFTSLTFLTPVFALICGVLLLGERLHPLQWLGVLLALLSVLLIHQRARLWSGGTAGGTRPAEVALSGAASQPEEALQP